MLLDLDIGVAMRKDKYIVSNGNDRYFIVNGNTLKMIRSLQSNSTIESAYSAYLRDHGQEVTFEHFQKVSDNLTDRFKSRREDILNQYLYLKIKIIPSRIAGKLGRVFTFLFNGKLFYPLLLCGLLINIINSLLLFSGNLKASGLNFSVEAAFMYGILLMAAPVIHEFGHIAGCEKYGARHGAIGIGFYFIFPVFYSDVSGIWMITRNDRIKVNLGGIYFELIYMLLLLAISLITQSYLFRVVSFINFTILLQQLNPFLRYDGYWVLSDILDYPNLKPNSKRAMIDIFNNISGRRSVKLNRGAALLAVFGFMSYGIILILLFVIFFSYTREIVEFPITVFRLVRDLISGNPDMSSVNFGVLIMAALFYFLIIQLIWRTIKIRFFKRDRKSEPNKNSRIIN
ncbi:MAG TPA: hypothetical protein PLV06_14760 [Bacteroidales bacterium]|nr:hypothetical protein [Bacteroidales bacterium]